MRNRERVGGGRKGEREGESDIYYIRKIGNWSREFDERRGVKRGVAEGKGKKGNKKKEKKTKK